MIRMTRWSVSTTVLSYTTLRDTTSSTPPLMCQQSLALDGCSSRSITTNLWTCLINIQPLDTSPKLANPHQWLCRLATAIASQVAFSVFPQNQQEQYCTTGPTILIPPTEHTPALTAHRAPSTRRIATFTICQAAFLVFLFQYSRCRSADLTTAFTSYIPLRGTHPQPRHARAGGLKAADTCKTNRVGRSRFLIAINRPRTAFDPRVNLLF